MKISIHQPEHFPYLGFIDKVRKSELLVIMDDVQYRKNYFQNRNQIRTATGSAYITVPVSHDSNTLIKDVKIADVKWKDKYLNAIKNAYEKAPNFNKYYSQIEENIRAPYVSLSDLNCELLGDVIFPAFDINIPVRMMSEMDIRKTTDGSDKVLAICEECQKIYKDPIIYISGQGGKEYLRLEEFQKVGIIVCFNEFEHPVYKQQFEPFLPNMSCLDYIMNVEDIKI